MHETTKRFQSVARRWRGTFDAEPDTSTGENLNRVAPRGDGGSGAQSLDTPIAACGLVGDRGVFDAALRPRRLTKTRSILRIWISRRLRNGQGSAPCR
jgi:hypothetical protein